MVALNKWTGSCLAAFIALVMVGCSPGMPTYLAGNLNGRNHTAAAINYFTVNGYGGPNISPYGSGGGYCCVMLPSKWQTGLVVSVEWETDPDPRAALPPLGTLEYRVAYEKHKANYKKHTATVEIPPYEPKTLCSLKIHFMPCSQIKATTACPAYGQPGYPIKEPRVMEEPAVCPK